MKHAMHITTPAAIRTQASDEQLAAIPDRMCQQCGLAPATRIKLTLKGIKRHVCQTCKDRAHKSGSK